LVPYSTLLFLHDRAESEHDTSLYVVLRTYDIGMVVLERTSTLVGVLGSHVLYKSRYVGLMTQQPMKEGVSVVVAPNLYFYLTTRR
jgi:hypothetical protein